MHKPLLDVHMLPEVPGRGFLLQLLGQHLPQPCSFLPFQLTRSCSGYEQGLKQQQKLNSRLTLVKSFQRGHGGGLGATLRGHPHPAWDTPSKARLCPHSVLSIPSPSTRAAPGFCGRHTPPTTPELHSFCCCLPRAPTHRLLNNTLPTGPDPHSAR